MLRVCLIVGLVLSAITSDGAEPIQFNRDIRPILSDKCFACHGPDQANQQAGLRLDQRERAISALESGETAISPGNPQQSALWQRITSDDPDVVMPPPAAKLGRLSPEEISVLTRWIESGAEYQAHWAFLPVVSPTVVPPAAGLPTGVAVRNPIDAFVFAGLAEQQLSPQPTADRETLIRRVTFDLTGLPPTTAEVKAFVSSTDPRAYELLVDRLLESPRYGERMAADWLDLARYADSYGFQVDREREMWPWRDWVIRAFNDNLPWDQFVTWQLAGDLLPNATQDQILATAFNRLHQQEAEGGSVEEEYRVNYVNDRVVTFGTAFLGLTLECCRCHDHKFDPITQQEYYQFFDFFDDIDEAGLYSFFTPSVPTPTLWLTNEQQRQQLQQAEQQIATEWQRLRDLPSNRQQSWEEWLKVQTQGPAALPDELAHFPFEARSASEKFDSSLNGEHSATCPNENLPVVGRIGQGLLLTGDHAVTTTLGNFHCYEPFSVSLWMQTPDVKDRAVILRRSQAWTDAGSRGYELLLEEGRLKWSLIHFWPGNACSIRAIDQAPTGEWLHVTVTSDGSSRAEGLKLYVNGQPVATEVIRDALTRDITGGGSDNIALGERFRDRGFKQGLVDELRVFGREIAPLEAAELYQPGTIQTLLTTSREQRTANQQLLLQEWYFAAYDDAARQQRAKLTEARQQESALGEAITEVMVMRESPEPRQAYVLKRGEYNLREAAAHAGTPQALPDFPAHQPRNRLGLATWLTDPQHPLLARVAVNRFWQACFGRGLVKTTEDFGSQSERPLYPELLDWLASDFIAQGWDVKRLLKTIVMSHTYQQRSFSSPEQMAHDPENVALARGPRHRLSGEMIRDQVLAVSGLLVEHVGGPPVRTYDMPESFKPSAAGTGEQLYRRSLYTFWRRTGPAPVLEAFDVPKRQVCSARRDVTNTPLHAFVLLNGPQFVEASRVLAQSLLKETQGQRDPLLAAAFQQLTSRAPDADETAILIQMYDQQLAWYTAHASEAEAFIKVGATPPATEWPAPQLAAATTVINTLMSYDGSVIKR